MRCTLIVQTHVFVVHSYSNLHITRHISLQKRVVTITPLCYSLCSVASNEVI